MRVITQMQATPTLAKVTTFESSGTTFASVDIGIPYSVVGSLQTGMCFLFPAADLPAVAKLLRAAADEAERLAPAGTEAAA